MSFERDGFNELRDYQTSYACAWAQSGFPSDQDVAEVFVNALPPVSREYNKRLQPLFELFRRTIDANIIPLNRIMENTAEGYLWQVFGMTSDKPFEDLMLEWTATPKVD